MRQRGAISSAQLSAPRYIDLEDTIRRRIGDGTYGVGMSLPSEASLVGEFGVSRFTAREALRRLGEAGLISRQQGARSRVIGTEERHDGYLFSAGSSEDLQQYAHDTHLSISSVTRLEARGSMARFLRCRDKRRWLCVRGVRISATDRSVVGYTEVYLWEEFEPHISEITTPGTPIHDQIAERLQIQTTRIWQEITAIPLPVDAAGPLECEVGAPALEIVRRYYRGRGGPFEVARNLHAAGEFTYSQEFHRLRGCR